MAISKKQQKSVQRYMQQHYYRMAVFVPVEQREYIQQRATKLGLSINAYVNNLIQKDLHSAEAADNDNFIN